MKHLIASAVAGLILAASAGADPVYGVWKTIPGDNGHYGHVNIAACGSRICGTLTKSFDGAGNVLQSGNVGKKIIWDMVSAGSGKYKGGKVWAPDRDKTYNSRMQLDGDSLKIRGCILGICRDGGTWTRLE